MSSKEKEIADSIHRHAFNLHLLIDRHAEHVAHDLLKLSPPIPLEAIPSHPLTRMAVLRALENGNIPSELFEGGEYPTSPFKRELVIGSNGDLKIRLHINPTFLFKVHRTREPNVTKSEFEKYITTNKAFVAQFKRGLTAHSHENPTWAQQILDRFKQPTVFEYTENAIKEFTPKKLVLEIAIDSLLKSRETRAKKERKSKKDKDAEAQIAEEFPEINALFTKDYETSSAIALVRRLRIAHDKGQREKKEALEKQLLCHHEDGPSDFEPIRTTHIVYE